jgi:hypothetical protein
LKLEYLTYVGKYPDIYSLMKQAHNVLCDIDNLAQYTPALVGESTEWTCIVNTAEENRASYYKVLTGWILFSALHGMYTVTLSELKAMLKASTQAGQAKAPKSTGQQITQEDGFIVVRRRKRHSTDETA